MKTNTPETLKAPPTIIIDAEGTHKIGSVTCAEFEAAHVKNQLKLLQVAHPKTSFQKLLTRALSAVRKTNMNAIKENQFPEEIKDDD